MSRISCLFATQLCILEISSRSAVTYFSFDFFIHTMSYAMKTDTFAKLFFVVSVTGFVMYAIIAFYTFHTAYTTMSDVPDYSIEGLPLYNYRHGGELKYILIWTDPDTPLLTNFYDGQKEFMQRKCPQTNCFLTTIKEYLGGEYTHFDAIIFEMNILHKWRKLKMPEKRNYRQKYVFYSTLASDVSPVCVPQADYFFNWTWTYKLYSDIVAPFIDVKDLNGEVVAPNPDVLWDSRMVNANYSDTKFMSKKTKAVVWVINKDITRTLRKVFGRALQRALKQFSLTMDIYRYRTTCPKDGCLKADNYYFYFAFEESIEDDYVTEEVLRAYNHNAVPIVIGGADYSQFLPHGSYINARTMTAENLATLINYVIQHPDVYLKFFRWKNYYTIDKTPRGYGICELCEMLNDNEKVSTNSGYEHFRRWWFTGNLPDRCEPRGTKDQKELLSYINNTGKHIKKKYLNKPYEIILD